MRTRRLMSFENVDTAQAPEPSDKLTLEREMLSGRKAGTRMRVRCDCPCSLHMVLLAAMVEGLLAMFKHMLVVGFAVGGFGKPGLAQSLAQSSGDRRQCPAQRWWCLAISLSAG